MLSMFTVRPSLSSNTVEPFSVFNPTTVPSASEDTSMVSPSALRGVEVDRVYAVWRSLSGAEGAVPGKGLLTGVKSGKTGSGDQFVILVVDVCESRFGIFGEGNFQLGTLAVG